MNPRLQDLQRQQTQTALKPWQSLASTVRPGQGWARAIRHSLGMTARALAKRLGMTPGGVQALEKAEAADAITLASLRKLAAAMDCELHYALVPRASLAELRRQRALQVARERLQPVRHTMSLEGQAVETVAAQRQVELLAEELLRGSGRELW